MTKHARITINCNPITWFTEQKGNICVLTIEDLKLEEGGGGRQRWCGFCTHPGPGFGPVLMVVLILSWSCPGSDPALVLVRFLSHPILVVLWSWSWSYPGSDPALVLVWCWSCPCPGPALVLLLSLSCSGPGPVLVLMLPWP